MAGKSSDKERLGRFFGDRKALAAKIPPACRHFGDCGGCEFQDMAYPSQLDAKLAAFGFVAGEVTGDWRRPSDAAAKLGEKAERLENSLSRVVVDAVAGIRQYGYRQRMDYVFAFGKAGLRRHNRHRQVVELEQCPLLGDKGFAAFRSARQMADKLGVVSYDYLRHAGELSYFVVRQSRNGNLLLSLVSKSCGPEAKIREILRRLVDDGTVASAHWLLAEGRGDVSFGQSLLNYGDAWIVENILGGLFRIGPNTFFQANPAVAELAYGKIAAFTPATGMVMDMYSGTGVIAAILASGGTRVKAVENVAANIELAELNFRENRVEGVEMVNAEAASCLEELAVGGNMPPAMIVVNPPRSGVGDRGMAAIGRIRSDRLAYLSCNPFSLLRDLADILDVYDLRSLTIYDMFPQTRHFEILALLESR